MGLGSFGSFGLGLGLLQIVQLRIGSESAPLPLPRTAKEVLSDDYQTSGYQFKAASVAWVSQRGHWSTDVSGP